MTLQLNHRRFHNPFVGRASRPFPKPSRTRRRDVVFAANRFGFTKRTGFKFPGPSAQLSALLHVTTLFANFPIRFVSQNRMFTPSPGHCRPRAPTRRLPEGFGRARPLGAPFCRSLSLVATACRHSAASTVPRPGLCRRAVSEFVGRAARVPSSRSGLSSTPWANAKATAPPPNHIFTFSRQENMPVLYNYRHPMSSRIIVLRYVVAAFSLRLRPPPYCRACPDFEIGASGPLAAVLRSSPQPVTTRCSFVIVP